ncbi:uncharacterized protein LOC130928092 isoform X3 [Corythoichthys intestinalis]|uniref:uncharacterized protein LOC130928092 isoform X3 n=1 Tax=Corythoichthys intestinalis TaxID=161448 RepID=UPI0025A67EF7|nr:uncharacterized protein LOC130928092 isoform X3 [Corythoichthys intestinalis]
MVKACVAVGCTNREDGRRDLKFYRIPRDPKRRAKWTAAIRRENWAPKSHHRLCSSHFISESETFVLQTPSEDGHILNGLTVSGHGAGSLQNSGESITTCTQLRSSIGMGSSSNNPHEDLLEEGKRGKVTAFYCDEETPTGYCICSCCPMQ